MARAHLVPVKRKRGTTWYVGYRDDNQKYVRIHVGGSKELADKVLGDTIARLERGDVGLIKKDYPLLKFFQEYLERTAIHHSDSYNKRKEQMIDNFKRYLAQEHPRLKNLTQITAAVVEGYQRFRLAERNPTNKRPITRRTANLEVSALKTCMSQAVKWDMIATNPMQNVPRLKEDDSKKIPALTKEQAKKLLDTAEGWFRPVLVTAIYTGLREGELIHLEWPDVDFREGFIRIRRKPGWLPKSSGRSIRERDVAIPPALVKYLRGHRAKNQAHGDNRVFHSRDGQPLAPGLRKRLMRLTKQVGFPEITQFHALRHTYATLLIEDTKDIAVAQAQLGHADIRTTMRYTDITAARKRRAVSNLNFGITVEDDAAEVSAEAE